jgi:undecaprenyl-diphosphatase
VSILHAIVLGAVQGLSEFLPISSSGHLQLVPWLFGWDDFAGNEPLKLAFDVALHIGTLLGAVAYFRRDLVRLARSGLLALRPRRVRAEIATEVSVPPAPVDPPRSQRRPGLDDDGRLAWLLVASAVPAAITGVLLSSRIEEARGQEWLIGVLLIVFGGVLLWADRIGGDRGAEQFRLRDALAMGVGQALALQPGVSRSGVTITVGRKLGFSRDAAARLSFLMSLPIIAGAVAYEAAKLLLDEGLPAEYLAPFLAGIVASAVTGWVAVWATLRLVRTRTFAPFVVYRCVVGVAVIGIAVTGLR